MKIRRSSVIVCSNSDAYGSEIGFEFKTVAESVARAEAMSSPHSDSWPSLMNQLGIPTLNDSVPGSGLFCNVARAIKKFREFPNALFLIDACLIDHLPMEDCQHAPRNALLFSPDSLEATVFSFDRSQQLFLINEQRKLLHQLGIQFHFVMFGNPTFDFTQLQRTSDRRNYGAFLKNSLLKPWIGPPEIQKDCLLPEPYFHYFDPEAISSFCHLTDRIHLQSVATMMANKLKDLYDFDSTPLSN